MPFALARLSSLERRFVAGLLPPLLFALTLASLASLWLSQSQRLQEAEEEGARLSGVFAQALLMDLPDADNEVILDTLKRLAQTPRVQGVRLHNRTTGAKLEAFPHNEKESASSLHFLRDLVVHQRLDSRPENLQLEISMERPSMRDLLLFAGGQLLLIMAIGAVAVIFSIAIHRKIVARPLDSLGKFIDIHESSGSIPSWEEAPPEDELGEAMRAYESACRRRLDTEKQLIVSQERLRVLSDNLPNAFLYQCRISPDWEVSFTYVGESVREVLGVTPEEVYKNAGLLRGIIHPDYVDEMLRIERQILRLRKEFIYECPILFPDGKYHWVQLLSRPSQMPDGEYLWQGVFIDMTETREKDAEIQRNRADAQAILNALPDPIFVQPFPGRGKGDHHFSTVNKSACEFLGMTETELLASSPGKIDYLSSDEIVRIRTELTKNKRLRFETTFIRKDGRRFPGEICASIIELSGKTVSISVARSLEDQKQREKQLQDAVSRVESVNRAMSAFLANLSHEIRTPLNGIIGFSEMLARTSNNELHRQQAASITSSGRSLLVLVNDILDLSKIESGRLAIRPGPLTLSALLNDVRAFFLTQIEQKQLELKAACSPDVPKEILMDEVRLRQILINLIGNAIKFTDDGGITLSARALPNVDSDRHIALRIEVADTGHGISEKEKERIFQPFEQGRSGEKSATAGSGLGLTISQRLASLLDGSLQVHDNPEGRGSVFVLDFPKVEIALDSGSGLTQEETVATPPLEIDPATRDQLITQASLLRQHLRVKDALTLASALRTSIPPLHDIAEAIKTAAENSQVDQLLSQAKRVEDILRTKA